MLAGWPPSNPASWGVGALLIGGIRLMSLGLGQLSCRSRTAE
jgi:hypothetical protein